MHHIQRLGFGGHRLERIAECGQIVGIRQRDVEDRIGWRRIVANDGLGPVWAVDENSVQYGPTSTPGRFVRQRGQR